MGLISGYLGVKSGLGRWPTKTEPVMCRVALLVSGMFVAFHEVPFKWHLMNPSSPVKSNPANYGAPRTLAAALFNQRY
ncbi:hypothetical protein FYZ43_01165 [Mobiluncus mulieris]|uniref:Uncharacterized protein n=1 Tax=Mobiluncus mulieris TaxID=2052 RepID=A0ABD4TVS9_9ACTO|nr:hypothetical protein [Mobiluncus mulieris]MCU9972973.1 hypothetical protein [Mobiluncus mulieris]MCV0010993.1 hypothetical protein [Mobiluncus mulieris]NMW74779.1 hypothetical protein [Mobiluncus mulieris]NMX00956.1 hypothetical protein [Mobiluncus mulieris]